MSNIRCHLNTLPGLYRSFERIDPILVLIQLITRPPLLRLRLNARNRASPKTPKSIPLRFHILGSSIVQLPASHTLMAFLHVRTYRVSRNSNWSCVLRKVQVLITRQLGGAFEATQFTLFALISAGETDATKEHC